MVAVTSRSGNLRYSNCIRFSVTVENAFLLISTFIKLYAPNSSAFSACGKSYGMKTRHEIQQQRHVDMAIIATGCHNLRRSLKRECTNAFLVVHMLIV